MSGKNPSTYKLRPKERINVFDRYEMEEADLGQ